MDSRWQAFLEDAGAVIADGVVSHFGNPAREISIGTTGNVLCDLSQLGLITASGDDAMAFLQGQLSNDISLLDSRHSQLSGYCNPQGRLLAILRIFIRDNVYHLELPRSLLDSTLERLRKYVLMSKVKLEDGGDCLVRMGYSGPDSETELAALVGGDIPGGVNEVRCTEELTMIRVAGPMPRFVIYGKTATMEKLWSALDVRAAPVGRQVWERLDILAGLPVVLPETVEAFIPQTVNLDLVDGISFKKGCYTGQEIVARLHYRGSIKRRMRLVHIGTDEPPAPGSTIHSKKDDKQAAGTVVLAAPSPDGGCDALAVIINAYAEEALYLQAPGHPPLEIRELPYPLPES